MNHPIECCKLEFDNVYNNVCNKLFILNGLVHLNIKNLTFKEELFRDLIQKHNNQSSICLGCLNSLDHPNEKKSESKLLTLEL